MDERWQESDREGAKAGRGGSQSRRGALVRKILTGTNTVKRGLSRATGQSSKKDSDMEVVEDATETESEEGTDTEPGLAPVPEPAREKRTKRKQRNVGLEGKGPPGKK